MADLLTTVGITPEQQQLLDEIKAGLGEEQFAEQLREVNNVQIEAMQELLADSEKLAEIAQQAGVPASRVSEVESVNDALITSDGKIVRFNANDNILAMQNMGQFGGADTVSRQEAMMMASNGMNTQPVVDAIQQLISELQAKQFTAIQQNNNQTIMDVETFRFATAE